MRVVLLALVLAFTGRGMAQSVINTEVGATGHAGFLMIHTAKMYHLRTSHSFGGELFGEWSVNGSKQWHGLLKYPRLGANLMVLSLGNAQLLGTGWATGGYVKFPVLFHNGPFRLSIRFGAGAGYLTKVYDQYGNYKNVAIGSRLNGHMNMGLEASYQVRALRFQTGIRFSHFSNGAMKMPNLGVNYPSVFAGVSYRIGDESQPQTLDVLDVLNRRWTLDMLLLGGLRELYPVGGPKYGGLTVQGRAIWRTHRGHSLQLLADVSYSAAYRRKLKSLRNADQSPGAGMRAGLAVGYALYLGEFSMFIHKGIYVANPGNADGLWFHRLGITRTFAGRYVTTISLKTHFFNADFIELGLGYCFRKWQ
jgi:hypothetical protein